jgi:predicted DNA-binding WGR domain protein
MPDDGPEPDLFLPCLHLRRVDSVRNMRRFYRVRVERDLFGGASLVRVWGRIGTRGRQMVNRHQDEDAAIAALLKLAREKRWRGYGPWRTGTDRLI